MVEGVLVNRRGFVRPWLAATALGATLLSSALAKAQEGAVQPAPAAPPPAPAAAESQPQPASPMPPAQAPPVLVAPQGPPAGYVPLVIQSRPRLRMELKLLELDGNPSYVDPSGGVQCDGSCRLDVPPGRYRLRVTEPDGKMTERTLRIRQPERLLVGPVDDGARTTGLVMGVVGSVMVPVGLYMMLNAAAISASDSIAERGDSDGPQLMLYGLMVFVTGAALAPVGWVMFGRSGKFTLDREALASSAPPDPSRFALGVAPLPGGGQLGAAFRF
jgi:hypothetical protein